MDTMLLCNDKRILNVFGIAVNFLIITALCTYYGAGYACERSCS